MLTCLRRKMRPAARKIEAQDLETRLLARLEAARVSGRVYQVRDLHKELGAPQPAVLRAIASLENRGRLVLVGGHFDPLSALIQLA